MSVYKNILIATDLSEENNVVIEKSLAIAQSFNAKVSVLHVVEPLPGYGYAYVGIADIEAELLVEANKSMKVLAKKYNIPETSCYVEVGPMKAEMISLINKEKIDCLILGSHGRHGFSELLGSTAHSAVHSAPCDVITLRIKTQ
ncbi:MAG: universal stress protein [Gammaproteobacteria bacterium]|nr:universal stress protein [Gammaproteobacteria bacterium]